jgi:hypothetical protein
MASVSFEELGPNPGGRMKVTPICFARRIPLVATLTLVAAGCSGHYDSGPPSAGRTPAPATPDPTVLAPSADATYALTLYWSFARHVRGQADLVGYDLSTAPGGSSRACAQSGVDTVVVYDASGASLDPTGAGVPCVYEGVQGASYFGFPLGTYDLTVTGYRNSGALEPPSASKSPWVARTPMT